MKYSTAPIVPLVVIVTACGGGAGGTGFTVRDSAGVELVEMSGGSVADVPALALREELRIGTVDGPPELQFFRVSAIANASDGTIYVADGGNHVIRKFTPDGTFLIEFGGEGEGPGKFPRGPWDLSVLGDTVVAVDRLIHVFSKDGTLIDAVRPRLAGRGPDVWQLDATKAGWFVNTRSGRFMTREGRGPFSDTSYVDQFEHVSGTLGATMFGYPRETNYILHGGFYVQPLLEPTPHHSVNTDGKVYYAAGAKYEIEVWSPVESVEHRGMTLTRRITASVPPLPITTDLIDLYLDQANESLENVPNVGEGAIMREIRLKDRLELERSEYRPVIGRLFASTTGELLAERLDLDENPFRTDNPTIWDLIGADGVIEGRVTLSDRFRPMALTSRGLLGVLRDAFDVQYVVRYRIEQAN